jgi:hypothetical protein
MRVVLERRGSGGSTMIGKKIVLGGLGVVGSGSPSVRALPLMIRRRIDACATGSGIFISVIIRRIITRPRQGFVLFTPNRNQRRQRRISWRRRKKRRQPKRRILGLVRNP